MNVSVDVPVPVVVFKGQTNMLEQVLNGKRERWKVC